MVEVLGAALVAVVARDLVGDPAPRALVGRGAYRVPLRAAEFVDEAVAGFLADVLAELGGGVVAVEEEEGAAADGHGADGAVAGEVEAEGIAG